MSERPGRAGSWTGLILGATVAAALIALLLLRAEPGRVAAALREARPLPLAALFGLHLAGLLLRISRWRGLLVAAGLDGEPPRDGGAPRAARERWLVPDAAFAGWLANLAAPARVGELLRPAIYAGQTGRSFLPVMATVLVERALDLAVLAAGFAAAVFLVPLPEGVPASLRVAAGAAGGLALALLGAVSLGARPAAGGLRGALAGLRRPPQLLHASLWSLGIWTIEVACVAAALRAFGISLPWSAALTQVVAVTLALAVVNLPGGLGVEQGVDVALFGAYGVEPARALALSFGLSAAAMLWVLPLGVWALVRQGIPLQHVLRPSSPPEGRG